MTFHVIDIAKGQERVVISLVNEVNSDSPPSFHYIPHNALFQNAYVSYSLARIGDNNCCSACSGDCLSLSTPCACAHEMGGNFAYTPEGLVKEEFLKECISMNRDPKKHCQLFCKVCPLERSKTKDSIEPCKGHLIRKFIKECWLKCGCNKQCGNRVVQRGISQKLQVFMTSRGKGWGIVIKPPPSRSAGHQLGLVAIIYEPINQATAYAHLNGHAYHLNNATRTKKDHIRMMFAKHKRKNIGKAQAYCNTTNGPVNHFSFFLGSNHHRTHSVYNTMNSAT